MGRNPQYGGARFRNGCFKVAWQNHGHVVTTHACADTGYWMGNNSNPMVTVVDTPGIGDDIEAEQKKINRIVYASKNDIKYVHAFVIAFQEGNNRITNAMLNMLNLFQKMYGDGFWENAILEATNWNHNPVNEEKRNSLKPFPETEKTWTNEFNIILQKKLNVSNPLKSVFIDSHYDADYQVEVDKFNENTKILFDFANTRKPLVTTESMLVLARKQSCG